MGKISPKSIRVLIFSAGRGERLKPLTNSIPKGLLEINGKKLIDYVIKSAKDNSLNNTTVLIGYNGQKIKNYLGKGYEYFEIKNLKDILSPLFHVSKKYREEVFLTLSSDSIFPSKLISSCLKEFSNKKSKVMVCFGKVPTGQKKEKYPEYEIKNNQLMDISSKEEIQKYSGLFTIFERKVLCSLSDISWIDEGKKYKKITGWNLLLKKILDLRIRVDVFISDEFFFNINEISDLESAINFLHSKNMREFR